MTPLTPCCLAVIETYCEIMDGKPREGAALYCPQCTKRIVLQDGTWGNAP
jgi:hypothetical protein